MSHHGGAGSTAANAASSSNTGSDDNEHIDVEQEVPLETLSPIQAADDLLELIGSMDSDPETGLDDAQEQNDEGLHQDEQPEAEEERHFSKRRLRRTHAAEAEVGIKARSRVRRRGFADDEWRPSRQCEATEETFDELAAGEDSLQPVSIGKGISTATELDGKTGEASQGPEATSPADETAPASNEGAEGELRRLPPPPLEGLDEQQEAREELKRAESSEVYESPAAGIQQPEPVAAPAGDQAADLEEVLFPSGSPEDGEADEVHDILPEPVDAADLDQGGSEKVQRRCLRVSCADFPFCTAHCPILFATLVILLTPLLIAALWPGFQVNNSMSAFLEADSPSNAVRSAYLGALPFRSPDARRLEETEQSSAPRELMTGFMPQIDPKVMYKLTNFVLLYRTTADGGILNTAILSKIRQFELGLRDSKVHQRICSELSTPGLDRLCDPGYSVINAAYPTLVLPGGEGNDTDAVSFLDQRLDGRGMKALPLSVTKALLQSKQVIKDQILPKKFRDGIPDDAVLDTVRSTFYFNMDCCMIDVSSSARRQSLNRLSMEWDVLMAEHHSKFLAFNKANKDIQVYFEGSGMMTYQLLLTLKSDSLMAAGSVSFIILYLTLHAGSAVVSCGAIFLTFLAIPAAFVATAVISGSNTVTGAAFLSLFLISGLGADIVLVFVAFWKDSLSHHEKEDVVPRIIYLYKNAGLACLATTLTTAASFFANLASVLRALREFGFFMGMCILGAYCYLLAGLPALLIINERVCRLGCRCRCCCRFPARKGKQNASKVPCWERLTAFCLDKFLLPYRWPVLIFFVLLVVSFAWWTASVVKVDAGVPLMFPEDHNLNHVEKIAREFEAAQEQWASDKAKLCNFVRHQDYQEWKACSQHQCQITLAKELTPVGTSSRHSNGSVRPASCQCMPTEEVLPVDQCSVLQPGKSLDLKVTIRVVGDVDAFALSSLTRTQDFKKFVLEAAERANPASTWKELDVGASRVTGYASSNPALLVQTYWETGEIFQTPYLVLPDYKFNVTLPKTPDAVPKVVCHSEQICYCGAAVCVYAGDFWVDPGVPQKYWTPLEIPAADVWSEKRRLEMESAFMTPGPASSPLHVPRRLRGTSGINLVWGLKIEGESRLLGKNEKTWDYNTVFRPESPHAQRTLLKACRDAQDHPDLLVVDHECWIEDFRSWAVRNDMPFPVPASNWDQSFRRWKSGRILPSGTVATDYLWLDTSGRLLATHARFTVAISSTRSSSGFIMGQMKLWNDFVQTLNGDAPAEVGETWHTSSLWIRAEAESAIIDSTVLTMIVSVGCGFMGALLFTHCDVFLSSMVVLNVTGVTIALAWFMIGFMSWKVGAIEVLGLIVFVGYSITYSLHIAHKYQEHVLEAPKYFTAKERRSEAVVHAVKCMSGAVLGSAATTLGSSFFLFFCTLVIFVKLATVLFAVTFFAGLFATVALPAALLCIGPTRKGCLEQLKALQQEAGRERSKTLRLGETDYSKPTAPSAEASGSGITGMTTSVGAPYSPAVASAASPMFSPSLELAHASPESGTSPFFPAERPVSELGMQHLRSEVFFGGSSPSISPLLGGKPLPRPPASLSPSPFGRSAQTYPYVSPSLSGFQGKDYREGAMPLPTASPSSSSFWADACAPPAAAGSSRPLTSLPPVPAAGPPGPVTLNAFRSLQEWSQTSASSTPQLTGASPATAVSPGVGQSWSSAERARASTAQLTRPNLRPSISIL
eukprot:TRINITY_DN27366_c0_g1_i1.p1 TRINITY_DN27366_c0_g1~~TRINITY_DN27366_c0_g1_i1.p1  ORF type:complete len:1723 (-),score=331.85 TRINITY_DN27366_c0_g1_i1:45-5213(-)